MVAKLLTQVQRVVGPPFGRRFADEAVEMEFDAWWWVGAVVVPRLTVVVALWLVLFAVLLVATLHGQGTALGWALGVHGAQGGALGCLAFVRVLSRRGGRRARLGCARLVLGCALSFRLIAWPNVALVLAWKAAPGQAYVWGSPMTLLGWLVIVATVAEVLLLRVRARQLVVLAALDVAWLAGCAVYGRSSGWDEPTSSIFTAFVLYAGTLACVLVHATAHEASSRLAFALIRKQDELSALVNTEGTRMLQRRRGSVVKNEQRVHDFRAEFKRLMAAGLIAKRQHTIPLEVERSAVVFGELLGEGAFGQVHKGLLTESSPGGAGPPKAVAVAIKTVKYDAGHAGAVALLEEAALMAQFEHDNVVALIGVCTAGYRVGKPSYVLIEFCQNGVLKEFLKQHKTGGFTVLGVNAKLGIALDIAAGMQYLARVRVVHRDLAARNVLMDDGYNCKVADFGMSRDISGTEGEYYRSRGGAVPTRWVPIEALEKRRFSEQSDVWAFGITLVEVFTGGLKPYPKMSNHQVYLEVKSGYRHPQPSGCPDEVYAIMMACWHTDPDARPCFDDLYADILALIPEEVQQRSRIVRRGSIASLMSTSEVSDGGSFIIEPDIAIGDGEHELLQAGADQPAPDVLSAALVDPSVPLLEDRKFMQQLNAVADDEKSLAQVSTWSSVMSIDSNTSLLAPGPRSSLTVPVRRNSIETVAGADAGGVRGRDDISFRQSSPRVTRKSSLLEAELSKASSLPSKRSTDVAAAEPDEYLLPLRSEAELAPEPPPRASHGEPVDGARMDRPPEPPPRAPAEAGAGSEPLPRRSKPGGAAKRPSDAPKVRRTFSNLREK